jgi:hypothetical protein
MLFQIKAALDGRSMLTFSYTNGQMKNDWIKPNFPAAGTDHCGWRYRGIDSNRSSRRWRIDASAGSEGSAEGGEVSRYAEG